MTTSNWMPEGGMERISLTSSSAQSRYVPSGREGTGTIGNAVPARSRRYGSQSYFWTQSWQQGERLADLDLLTGDEYQPTDVDDLLRWLESDDD